MRSVPNNLPINFQTLEMFTIFPAIPVVLGDKRRKIEKKGCPIRTALTWEEYPPRHAVVARAKFAKHLLKCNSRRQYRITNEKLIVES